MSRLLYRLSYPAVASLPGGRESTVRPDRLFLHRPPVRGCTGRTRAPMRNRTADLLLTMETLCLLSYRGLPLPSWDGTDGPRYTPTHGGRESSSWQVLGSNQRRRCRQIYSLLPLATRATCRAGDDPRIGSAGRNNSKSAGRGRTGRALPRQAMSDRMGPSGGAGQQDRAAEPPQRRG